MQAVFLEKLLGLHPVESKTPSVDNRGKEDCVLPK